MFKSSIWFELLFFCIEITGCFQLYRHRCIIVFLVKYVLVRAKIHNLYSYKCPLSRVNEGWLWVQGNSYGLSVGDMSKTAEDWGEVEACVPLKERGDWGVVSSFQVLQLLKRSQNPVHLHKSTDFIEPGNLIISTPSTKIMTMSQSPLSIHIHTYIYIYLIEMCAHKICPVDFYFSSPDLAFSKTRNRSENIHTI